MSVVEEARLIWADADANHNKFWHAKLHDNGDVEVEWGRVGYTGQSKTHHGAGSGKFESLKKSKLKKGYTEQRTVAASASSGKSGKSGKSIAKSSLKDQALKDIGGCPTVRKLVSWLAEVNVHKITTSTQITYDTSTGTFSTPLGLVTADGLADARDILNQMADFVQRRDFESSGFKTHASDFLRIVPQNIGMKQGWHRTLFGSNDLMAKQYDLLDSLDASLTQARKTPPKKSAKTGKEEAVWEVRLEKVDDPKVHKYVKAKYNKDKGHHRDVAGLDVKTVFSVQIPTIAAAFARDGKKVGGIMKLWHGTKASNLLSILKVGLVIPPASAGHCTGRMFGNGVYFSDQSTKAIRYATNAWSYGGRTDRTFMFLAEVAMGKPHHPRSSNWSMTKAPAGYDSTFAKAGGCVMNNEMIVYRTSQCNLLYLIEFTPGGR